VALNSLLVIPADPAFKKLGGTGPLWSPWMLRLCSIVPPCIDKDRRGDREREGIEGRELKIDKELIVGG